MLRSFFKKSKEECEWEAETENKHTCLTSQLCKGQWNFQYTYGNSTVIIHWQDTFVISFLNIPIKNLSCFCALLAIKMMLIYSLRSNCWGQKVCSCHHNNLFMPSDLVILLLGIHLTQIILNTQMVLLECGLKLEGRGQSDIPAWDCTGSRRPMHGLSDVVVHSHNFIRTLQWDSGVVPSYQSYIQPS